MWAECGVHMSSCLSTDIAAPLCPRAQRLLTNFCVSVCLLKLEASFSERTSGPMSKQTDTQKNPLIPPLHTYVYFSHE